MDRRGNMPDEPGYNPSAPPPDESMSAEDESETTHYREGVEEETRVSLESEVKCLPPPTDHPSGWQLLHELFCNPGLFLLFGGILVGYISRLQGLKVVEPDDKLFVTLFQGLLCLFLLEMGMTASRHLKDLASASWKFIVFGLVAPNIFAVIGMCTALAYSHAIGMPLQLGTYVLFAVLCAAASYIAVPAIQRLAIPEASPTLPLAASLGLTFSYNVTIGIPVYLIIAQELLTAFPLTH